MTTLITISSLIIGAILGAWWQNHRDIKDHRILANRNIDLNNELEKSSRQLESNTKWFESAIEVIARLKQENQKLRFQIQQHNIGRDEMKFTGQDEN